MRIDGCHALITGASSGLGREFARQLGGRAQLLVLVARRLDRLEELRRELMAAHPHLLVDIRQTDLGNAGETSNLIASIEEEKSAVDLLINNAGLGDIGPFSTAEPEKVDQMMLVNMVALTRLTRALLPSMLVRKSGAILNVSSSAGFLPMPNFAVYAATKAYVTNFSEALRSELRGSGISVTALCPGPVRTEFTDVAHRKSRGDYSLGPAFVYVSAEGVVRAALRGVANDRPLVIPGLVMKLGMGFVRLAPLQLLRLTSRFRAKSGP